MFEYRFQLVFLPVGGNEDYKGMMGHWPVTHSETLRKLVEIGVPAVPMLIAHLNDKRATKIAIHIRYYGFRQEDSGYNYTVMVGDLCYVALGQIVNRNYNSVIFAQFIVVNSPTTSEAVRTGLQKEWGRLTLRQHRASLIKDFQNLDIKDQWLGATLRLGYYYPDTLTPLVLKRLSAPGYDESDIEALIYDGFYKTDDVHRRKEMFVTFMAKHGEVYRQALLKQLFYDLSVQEEIEAGRASVSADFTYRPRECLTELFGYPKGVKSKDGPHLHPVSHYDQEQLIDSLVNFPNAQFDSAVRRVLYSTDNSELAVACIVYLISRGADADIRQYVSRHFSGTTESLLQEIVTLYYRSWANHPQPLFQKEGQGVGLAHLNLDARLQAVNDLPGAQCPLMGAEPPVLRELYGSHRLALTDCNRLRAMQPGSPGFPVSARSLRAG